VFPAIDMCTNTPFLNVMMCGLALVIVGLMRVVGISSVLQSPSALPSDLCSYGVHSGSQLASFHAGLAAEKV
jgi:hypothetical protein